MERTADRYRCWVQNIIKANKMKTKKYQVRVAFKSPVPNVKIKPASMTGIAIATTAKKAEELAINRIRENGNIPDIIITATSKIIPMTFYINPNDETDSI